MQQHQSENGAPKIATSMLKCIICYFKVSHTVSTVARWENDKQKTQREKALRSEIQRKWK